MEPCLSEKIYNLYIEDGLSEEELICLETHAGKCPSCRVELEQWKALKKALADEIEVEAPASLKSKVMEGVRDQKILNLAQPLSLKRMLTAAGLIVLIAAYYLIPSLKPYTAAISQAIMSYLGELFYNTISFFGLDMREAASFFKAFMSMLNNFYMVFAAGTLMLIVGFFSLILKGNAKLKTN